MNLRVNLTKRVKLKSTLIIDPLSIEDLNLRVLQDQDLLHSNTLPPMESKMLTQLTKLLPALFQDLAVMVDHHLSLNQEFRELVPLINQQFKEPLKDQPTKLPHPATTLELALAQELDLAQESEAHQATKLLVNQALPTHLANSNLHTKLVNPVQLTNNLTRAATKALPKEVEQD